MEAWKPEEDSRHVDQHNPIKGVVWGGGWGYRIQGLELQTRVWSRRGSSSVDGAFLCWGSKKVMLMAMLGSDWRRNSSPGTTGVSLH